MTESIKIVGLKDIYLCSYLLVHFDLQDAVKVDSFRYEFQFVDSDELRDEIDKYYRDTVSCSPNSLFSNLKMLKNLVYGGKSSAK